MIGRFLQNDKSDILYFKKILHFTFMKFIAEINIMPHRELLDPQGKTVLNNLHHLDLDGFTDVRMGKRVQMTLDATSENEARAAVETACKKLLANLIMENYSFELSKG